MEPRAGFIYGLYTPDDGEIFYVGRTYDMTNRLKQHRHAAPTGTEAKYEYIRTLGDRQWDIIELDAYTVEEGYMNKEDDAILTLLVADATLYNMIKGSAAWKERYERRVSEMKLLGFTDAKTYKEYKEGENMKKALERNRARIAEDIDPQVLHQNAVERRRSNDELKRLNKETAAKRRADKLAKKERALRRLSNFKKTDDTYSEILKTNPEWEMTPRGTLKHKTDK